MRIKTTLPFTAFVAVIGKKQNNHNEKQTTTKTENILSLNIVGHINPQRGE
jgi:hypothetical protein